jgi:hypothetical protein
MKQPLLVALLAIATFFHFRDSAEKETATEKAPTSGAVRENAAPQPLIIAPAPSYADRWKTGPNAQTDLKTGPNAQTDFEPFAPDEQATWNQTPGYTITSAQAARIR